MILDKGPLERIAVFGGVYNNHLSLKATLDAAHGRCDEVFCLGDVGGFGPSPAKSIELLRAQDIPTMLGFEVESIIWG